DLAVLDGEDGRVHRRRRGAGEGPAQVEEERRRHAVPQAVAASTSRKAAGEADAHRRILRALEAAPVAADQPSSRGTTKASSDAPPGSSSDQSDARIESEARAPVGTSGGSRSLP